MTAPYQPQIIKAPDSDVGQGLAPLIQAMQFRQHLQEQRAEEEQRVAAQLFAHGLATPGFENTPAAQALSAKLGVPDLAKSIGKARITEENRKIADINTFVEGLSGISDKAKSGLRTSLIAGTKGATADVQNSLFSAMASGEDITILERARLENLQANTQHIQLEIEKMRREPGPHDQQRAAQLLGIDVTKDFVEGTNYIGVLEDRLKQKETDPARVITNIGIALMSQRDFVGRAKLIPEEAFSAAIRYATPMFPKTAGVMKLTPDMTQVLDGTDKATQVWMNIRDNDNKNIEMNPVTGAKKVLDNLPTRAARREFVERGLKRLYPLLSPQQVADILDIVGRRVEEAGNFSF